ncbi:MAG: purine-binding chemotaxis protein CheW [Deltaproteobacteria bacterium]|nr:purine-binding chemotaxis protein CheW [Deltaproteobacteria bacterium]
MHDLSQVVSETTKRLNDRYTLKHTSEKGGKHLVFHLADQEYGIDIISVKEIIGMMPIRSVPRTPRFVKGVINLRGKVIPVIDLRLKLGLLEQPYTEKTCIIITEIQQGRPGAQVGMVVDAVSEVLNLSPEDIEGPPELGSGEDAGVIMGIAKTDAGARILLDTDRLLGQGVSG